MALLRQETREFLGLLRIEVQQQIGVAHGLQFLRQHGFVGHARRQPGHALVDQRELPRLQIMGVEQDRRAPAREPARDGHQEEMIAMDEVVVALLHAGRQQPRARPGRAESTA